MIPIRWGWRRTGLGLLAALLASIPGPSARAVVLVEDAAGDDPTVEASTAARWEALAVSSPRSSIDNDARALSVSLAPGDRAAFSRAADLAPAPSTVLCTFNVQVSDLGVSKPALQVFRMGWNFGTPTPTRPMPRPTAESVSRPRPNTGSSCAISCRVR